MIRVLVHVLGALGPSSGSLGASIALILGEWVMRIPLDVLLSPAKPCPILLSVLTVSVSGESFFFNSFFNTRF